MGKKCDYDYLSYIFDWSHLEFPIKPASQGKSNMKGERIVLLFSHPIMAQSELLLPTRKDGHVSSAKVNVDLLLSDLVHFIMFLS